MGRRGTSSTLWKRLFVGTVAAAWAAASVGPAHAIQFELGETLGAFELTIGYAMAFRTQEPRNFNPERPNTKSDWTFDRGLSSIVFRGLGELDLEWRNLGIAAGGSYFYDYYVMKRNSDREGAPFPVDTGLGDDFADHAQDASGAGFDLLEAYVYGVFEPFDKPLDLRAGWQVINWGEGLFFLGGVSTQVPLNINKLVLPGSELKEAFIPLPGILAQVAATDTLSVQAFYQLRWEKAELPGVGTFYGSDRFGPGGVQEWKESPVPPTRTGDDDAVAIPGDDDKPGQWGVAANFLVADDSELGFYYTNYHEYFPHLELTLGGAAGVTFEQVYPEKIDMYGVSFATTVGDVALAGEIAYRPNQPVVSEQPADAFEAALRDAAAGLSGKRNLIDRKKFVHVSVNALYATGPRFGMDDNFISFQLGVDYLPDPDRAPANAWITRDRAVEDADTTAWGAAIDWEARLLNALPGLDVSPGFFFQFDFAGNSHFWGNFAEDRLQGQVRVTFNYLTDLEVGLSYNWAIDDDSNFETRDTVNLSVDYKF